MKWKNWDIIVEPENTPKFSKLDNIETPLPQTSWIILS